MLTPNCLGNMVPPPGGWASLTDDVLVFYIHNSERTARGLLPFEGVETSLDQVAQGHTDYMMAQDFFSHYGNPAQGTGNIYNRCTSPTSVSGSSPGQRINSNVLLNGKYSYWAENIAVAVNFQSSFPNFSASSMYSFIYTDAGSAWGHRINIFRVYTNNYGGTGSEGFIGVGVTQGTNYQTTAFGCGTNWAHAKILNVDYYDPINVAPGTFSFITVVLPARLREFTAQTKGSDIEVSWLVDLEENLDHYELEHSKNGLEFDYLAELEARGTTNDPTQYLAKDFDPYDGVNYYRLKMIDFDGSFTYSKICQASIFSDRPVPQIYPNPFQSILTIEGGDHDDMHYVLTDLLGQKVAIGRISNQKHELDLSSLLTGVYILQLFENEHFVSAQKLLKH